MLSPQPRRKELHVTTQLLNNVDHHDLRVITRRGRELGDAVNQVLAFPNEFESLQRHYPIVFRKSVEGPIRPVAILGLARDENLFLDGEGDWADDAYVPAVLQRGPFSIATPDEPGAEPKILVDPDHPRASREDGTAVFLPHGGHSPYLERVIQVLRTLYDGNGLLDPVIASFGQAGLLRPANLHTRVSETETYAISDVSIVDAERLAALDGAALTALHRGGFLQSAFLAAASLGNLPRLAERKARANARVGA